jgi:outer membrane protein OmpA-like peptidoglycan-associated protein
MLNRKRTLIGAAIVAALGLTAVAEQAVAQPRFDFRDDPRAELVGPGVRILVPELRETRRGRAFVARNFDFNDDGVLSWREAQAANRAFLGIAGRDRGGFDWDNPFARGGYRGGDVDEVRGGHERWRSGMRAYHFRQGRWGAMFSMSDVLFETGSAELRPGAAARLQALADYLGDTSGARVRIDGFTDSVGSDESNEVLSRNRARSVGRALAQMGVPMSHLSLSGHGEEMPVASNDTATGRQLNRRVEVTLVGRRASEFN